MGTRGKAPDKLEFKTPALMIVLCGLVVVSLGATIVSSPHLGILPIVPAPPELPPLHDLAAIGLGISGLALAVYGIRFAVRRSRLTKAAYRELQEEIAGHRETERELRESEERLRAMLDSATGISVISADEAGLITSFSRGSERLLGYAAAEMIGKRMPAVFHDPAELHQRARELSEELGRPVEGFEIFMAIPRLRGSERREWTYLCKDGSRRTVDLTVTVLGGATGRIGGYLGTALDVTGRKESERELHETLRAGEAARGLHEAAGRIARLGHWELFLDGRPPQWSEVTYALHELPAGTPIAPEQALSSFDPADRDAIGQLIQRSIDTGEVFEFETRLTTARGAAIWVHSRGEPVKDEQGKVTGLRGVLQDIDGPRRARELLEERNRLLEVAICHSLVQKIGDCSWADPEISTKDDSTFHFEIPLHEVDIPAPALAPAPPPDHGESLEDRRVLIVDDDRTNRWLLQMQVASWGMQPTVVDGARAALQRIERGERFELAILDGMMPDIDGYELAAAIRRHRSASELPILMLAPMGDRRSNNAAQLGISGTLTKPVKTLPLFHAIRDLLAGPPRDEVKSSATAGERRVEKLAGECPLRILVAEDHSVNPQVVALLLQRMGYQPSVVAHGLEVLEALQHASFHVILLDLEMDGLEAAREIRRRYPRRDQRPWMIALTTRTLAGDLDDECLEAVVDDSMTKPVRRDNLERALRQAFNEVSPQVG